MPPSYSELVEEIKSVGLEDDPEIQKYLELYDRVESRVEEQNYAKIIRKKCRDQRQNPFPKAPATTYSLQESLYLGNDWKQNTPFSLTENQLTEHTLIAAQSGAGKTTLIYQILPQLSIPFWALDLKKDYRHLLNKVDDLVVIPKQQLRVNPLKPPPGVTWNEWKNRVIEVLCDATHLLDASQNYINKHLKPIYQAHLEEIHHPINEPPTLQLLNKRIQNHKPGRGTKEYQYYDTVTNRLDTLTEGLPGQIFQHPQGYDLEQLLHRPVVFELDNLDRNTQNFLMELLIEWQLQYRRKHGHNDGETRSVVVADEGKQLFDKNKEKGTASGIPHISFLVSKIRSFGTGLIAADQEARKLVDSLKANTDTKIILPNSDHKQLDDMAKSMGLHRLHRRHAEDLDVGEAIIKNGSEGPYRIQVNHADVERDVSDSQVLENLRQQPFFLSFRREEQLLPNPEKEFEKCEQPEQREDQSNPLSTDAKHLLKSLAENPFKKITAHYDHEFNSRQTAVDAKTELEKHGFLGEPQHVALQEARRKLYPFTDKARNYLKNEGVEIQAQGRGGIVHQFWQHHISKKLEEHGWKTEIEKFDADIYAEKNSTELAVEIALSSRDRELEHIQNHLHDRDVDQVITCFQESEDKREFEEKLEDTDVTQNQVSLLLVQHLLKDENVPQT